MPIMAALLETMASHPIATAVVGAAFVYVVTRAFVPLLPSASRPKTKNPIIASNYSTDVHARTREETRVLEGLAPSCSPAQQRGALLYHRQQPAVTAARGHDHGAVPKVCLVTGGTGFVGQRLVEMLVERGAEKVISFDIVPKPEGAWEDPRIHYVLGDITDKASVDAAVKGVDCVWHNAAAVGPFHPLALYDKVNYHGTLNVLDACKKYGVKRVVMSSSPSTRFDGSDVDGLTEDQMPAIPMKSYLQAYAGSKARGEVAMREALADGLLTVAVAPHQVYGPRDNLFLPNLLEAGATGLLRVFSAGRTGYGRSRVCLTHVDNYAHGLIMACSALYPGSPALGKFYIVTDGDTHPFKEGYAYLWDVIDEAVVSMGFASVYDKVKLPDWLLFPVAHACNVIGWLLGKRLKLNPFNVKMLTIHRWFRIDAAVKDLGYYPIVPFKDGWADCLAWTQQHWLPKHMATRQGGITGIASQSQRKIDIQADSALKGKKSQ